VAYLFAGDPRQASIPSHRGKGGETDGHGLTRAAPKKKRGRRAGRFVTEGEPLAGQGDLATEKKRKKKETDSSELAELLQTVVEEGGRSRQCFCLDLVGGRGKNNGPLSAACSRKGKSERKACGHQPRRSAPQKGKGKKKKKKKKGDKNRGR